MSATDRLSLPYIAPQQAQRQVTYNTAMAMLDQLVQPVVLDSSLAAPPPGPAPGDAYLVAAGASGAWAGHDGDFATYRDGAWQFRAPAEGWLAYDGAAALLLVRAAGGWQALTDAGGADLPFFGVNMAADSTTRLAVAAAGSLFTHDGDDHRLAIDKAASGDVASLVLQTGFSGRAELGLVGDDDFRLKVSVDGASWLEPLRVARATGAVSLPLGQLGFPATQNASADPNTLDDYEEGSWTPVLQFGGNSVGITYGTQLGRYTKIGRSVSISCNMILTSKGSSTGTAIIAGLPFACANDGIHRAVAIGYATSFTGVTGAVIGLVQANNARIALYQSANGAASVLSNTHFGGTTQVHLSAVYDV